MCRMAAYIGPELRLDRFLLNPSHSLVEQAYSPREQLYAILNADGFGFGWYARDGRPAVYLNTLPIWNDPNLAHLGRVLHSSLWVAGVRSATAGMAIAYPNTQPFFHGELIFQHNGFVRPFDEGLRPLIHRYLDPTLQAQVRGHTDSEYLFAMLRDLLADNTLALDGALAALFERLQEWIPDAAAMLNVMVTDGRRIYATRHAMNEPCPSLYFTHDDEQFPGAQVVASEPLTDEGYWTAVPEHHLLILDGEQPPELLPL